MGSSRGHGEYGRSYSLAATIQICMGCSVTRQWLSFGCTWSLSQYFAVGFCLQAVLLQLQLLCKDILIQTLGLSKTIARK